MAIKITLKNSVVQDSVPTTSHLAAVGELALNANINSLGIYMRASDNSIVKMAGPGSVTTPAASTTVAGIAELATSTETTTGTDTARVCTPAGVKAVTDAERTTSNSTYLALAGGTLTGVVAATAGSNSAPAIHFGDSDSGIFGGTNTVSLAAGGTTRLTADTGVSVVGALAVTGTITSTDDLTIPDKIIHSGDTDTAIRFPAANTVSFENGGSESARLDSAGRVLIGTSTFIRVGASSLPKLQVCGTTENAAVTLSRYSADNDPSRLSLGKARGATVGTMTVVQDNDGLGEIVFCGADGTDLHSKAASIVGEVDGTPGADDLPGRLVFGTTADGAALPTTRLTIDSAGLVNVPDNGKFTAGASDDLQIFHDGTNSAIDNGTGDFLIRQLGSSGDIYLDPKSGERGVKIIRDGGVELYCGNGKKAQTYADGLNVLGDFWIDNQVNTGRDVWFDESADTFKFYTNVKATFGTGNELQIYHDGTDSYINNTTGSLLIKSDYAYINDADGNNFIRCEDGSYVSLHHNGNKRIETTQYGIKITGAASAIQATGSGECQVLLGSTDAGGAAIYFDGDSNGDFSGSDYSWIKQNSSGDMEYMADAPAGATNHVFKTQIGSLFTIRSDKDVEIHDGNLVLAANHGIMFNPHDATDSSNTSSGTYGSDSNLLADYEEGSANITVYFGTTDGSDITYTSSNEQRGWYTKIGRFVHVNGAIGLANKGSGTGGFYFKGLPFATSNKTGSRLGGVITYADNFVGVGSDMHLYSIQNNSNKVYVYRYDSDGNSHVLSNSHIANNTTLRFSLTYMTD